MLYDPKARRHHENPGSKASYDPSGIRLVRVGKHPDVITSDRRLVNRCRTDRARQIEAELHYDGFGGRLCTSSRQCLSTPDSKARSRSTKAAPPALIDVRSAKRTWQWQRYRANNHIRSGKVKGGGRERQARAESSRCASTRGGLPSYEAESGGVGHDGSTPAAASTSEHRNRSHLVLRKQRNGLQ